MFNKDMYLLAYGNIYSNKGAMTPGASGGTADGMSEAMIDEIIGLMRFERYRFAPTRRVYIPKKNGKLRPLGIPSWRDRADPRNLDRNSVVHRGRHIRLLRVR